MSAVLLGWPVPLLPIQILWVNLVTDDFPPWLLGSILRKRGLWTGHRARRRKDLQPGSAGPCVFRFSSPLLHWRFQHRPAESVLKGQSMAFITLSLCQLVHVFNFRSLHESVFKRGLFGNKHLLLGVLAAGLLQAAVIFLPFLQEIFRVVDLTAVDWLRILGLVISPLVVGEIWKAAIAFRDRRGA